MSFDDSTSDSTVARRHFVFALVATSVYAPNYKIGRGEFLY